MSSHMTLSQLIARLTRIQNHVGSVPVFFEDNYNRVAPCGHAVLARATSENSDWEDAGVIVKGSLVVHIQQ